MKKPSVVVLVLVTALGAATLPATAIAQAVPATPAKPKMVMKEMDEHHATSGWKELDAFHTLMAATWHPVAKSNDLKPIRERSGELSDAAQAWAASKVPASCETKPIRDAITAVASGSKEIAQLVKNNAPDADVKNALKALHTRFEVVEEGCKPSPK